MRRIVCYPKVSGGADVAPYGVQFVRTLIASYYKGYDTVGSRPYIMSLYEKQ